MEEWLARRRISEKVGETVKLLVGRMAGWQIGRAREGEKTELPWDLGREMPELAPQIPIWSNC